MAGRTGEVEGFEGFGDEAYEFYEGLIADNSKTYWTAHKDVYGRAVREPMVTLLDALAPRFDATPVVFRPYRDVRFSADKSPYKTAQGAYLEVVHGLGYWVQVGADGVQLGGGFYPHDRDQLTRFRAAIDEGISGSELATLVARLEKAGFTRGGDTVRTRPRGVAADHPRLDLMRHQSLTVSRPVDDADSNTPRFAVTLAADWKKITPLIDWLHRYAPPS